jgi:hypothetical protein
MPERALKCPQCNAPLPPVGRFARSVVCPFCSTTVLLDEQAISVARFRAAFKDWNSPASHGFSSWISIGARAGESHWALGEIVGRGEISDVYAAQRARWPTERALVKVLRNPGSRRDAASFDHEREVLAALQGSRTAGYETFVLRLPQPIAHGEVSAGTSETSGGALASSRALVLRWAEGYVHTFEDAARAYPGGIEPRASIWIWRRILETLSFLHGAGYVHGAVLPPHLLVETGEHGVRLVGFRAADHPGAPLAEVSPRFERFYPRELLKSRQLSPAADLAMSARAVAALLGGDPASGEVPRAVPAPLAAEIARAADFNRADELGGAWALRERLGAIAHEVFGPPAFCPLVLP